MNNKPVELEEGIKLITEESIENIRKSGGESFSFNFKKAAAVSEHKTKPYLPQKKVNTSDAIDAIPVGVIKPISRNEDQQSHQQTNSESKSSKKCIF